jgi:hypothetical protein
MGSSSRRNGGVTVDTVMVFIYNIRYYFGSFFTMKKEDVKQVK